MENTQRYNRQILVVDDDHENLEFLSNLITKSGFDVVTEVSGSEGLRKVVNSVFDIVFTDSKMILEDGFSLAYHIKSRSPKTPVVMLVGWSTQNPTDKKEGCCMDYLLFKPFEFKDIQFTVRKFLGTWLNKKHTVSIPNEPCAIRQYG